MEKIMIKSWESVEDHFDEFVKGEKKGIIQLPVSLVNINEWYGENLSPYAIILGMSQADFEKIVYYCSYVIIDQDTGSYRIAGEKEYLASVENNENIKAYMGAEAIRVLFSSIGKEELELKARELVEKIVKVEQKCMATLEALNNESCDECAVDLTEIEVQDGDASESEEEGGESLADKIESVRIRLFIVRKKLDAFWYYEKYGLSRLLFDKIQLFPLEVRTALKDECRHMTYSIFHDLESLCGRVASRVQRVNKLMELNAPDIIIRNEKRMLQEYVDAYINNGKRGRPVSKAGEEYPMVSLTDILTRRITMY